jgi:hypothetical protein
MKAFLVFLALLVLGIGGVVVYHQQHKAPRIKAPAIDEDAVVSTISTGQTVDIDAYVPRKDLTIVEFSAAF